MKCGLSSCQSEFQEGQGVDHEEDKLYTFCSLDHFKQWFFVDRHKAAIADEAGKTT